jgi:hypothetical protein
MIRKQQETRATARIGNGGLLQTDAMVPDKLDLCQAIDDVVGAVCTRKKNFNKSDEVYMLLCYYICKALLAAAAARPGRQRECIFVIVSSSC